MEVDAGGWATGVVETWAGTDDELDADVSEGRTGAASALRVACGALGFGELGDEVGWAVRRDELGFGLGRVELGFGAGTLPHTDP